ncbi:MAG: alkaline shock response membrane anchor protein AmaP [Dehalococcoidia bacterium]
MTLRRMLLALYSLLFIAACGGLIGLVWNEDQKLDINLADGDFNLEGFITANDTWQVFATTALGLLILFGLWTLLMALLPAGSARSSGMLRLKQANGGTVEVTSQALERLVRDELEALPEVRQAIPRVKASGGSVDTHALVVIEQQASIAHVTSVVNDTVTRAFKEQVGVTNVKRPNIRISYEPVKGQPISDRDMRYDSTRPVAPPVREDGEEAVSWPPPPADVARADAPEARTETDTWPSEPGSGGARTSEPAVVDGEPAQDAGPDRPDRPAEREQS